MNQLLTLLAGSLLRCAATRADASLEARAGGMVDGARSNLTWALATAWADALQWGGVDDWRLPASSACLGFNGKSSGIGALGYAALGKAAGQASVARLTRRRIA